MDYNFGSRNISTFGRDTGLLQFLKLGVVEPFATAVQVQDIWEVKSFPRGGGTVYEGGVTEPNLNPLIASVYDRMFTISDKSFDKFLEALDDPDNMKVSHVMTGRFTSVEMGDEEGQSLIDFNDVASITVEYLPPVPYTWVVILKLDDGEQEMWFSQEVIATDVEGADAIAHIDLTQMFLNDVEEELEVIAVYGPYERADDDPQSN